MKYESLQKMQRQGTSPETSNACAPTTHTSIIHKAIAINQKPQSR